MNKISSIAKDSEGDFVIEYETADIEFVCVGKLFDVISHLTDTYAEYRKQDVVQVNFLMANTQAAALAHGVTSALIAAKNIWSIESFEFKAFEQICQSRIGQCVAAMLHSGLDMDEINHRIKQGH